MIGKASYRKQLVASQSARTYSAYIYASAGPSETTTDTVFGGHCIIAECGEILQESALLELQGSMILADINPNRCVQERINSTSWFFPASNTIIETELNFQQSEKHEILREISPTPFVPGSTTDLIDRAQQILQIQATGLAVRLQKSGSQSMCLDYPAD